jgi:hypothetical protein
MSFELSDRRADLLSAKTRTEGDLRATEDFLTLVHLGPIPLRQETLLFQVDGGLCRWRRSLGGRGGRDRRCTGTRRRGSRGLRRRRARGIGKGKCQGARPKARQHSNNESHHSSPCELSDHRTLPGSVIRGCGARWARSTPSRACSSTAAMSRAVPQLSLPSRREARSSGRRASRRAESVTRRAGHFASLLPFEFLTHCGLTSLELCDRRADLLSAKA